LTPARLLHDVGRLRPMANASEANRNRCVKANASKKSDSSD
jgi:hypothetical protein